MWPAGTRLQHLVGALFFVLGIRLVDGIHRKKDFGRQKRGHGTLQLAFERSS